MSLEEAIIVKLRRLPEREREIMLRLIDEWMQQHRTADAGEIQRAVTAVQNTWATLTLNQKTLRWVAEDKEPEYDLG